jgi:DNA-directed RNA polymerase III subunit RPC8
MIALFDPDVGLVISLFDIVEIGDSHIFPGDGSSHTRVVFRLLVFRPFIEEVLVPCSEASF